MNLAFGLTEDAQNVEWFNTYDEAIEAHQKKSRRWLWSILVYGYAQRLCTIIYHPPTGYHPVGFVTADGVDLLEKYSVRQEMYKEVIE